jgi:hypothetical protein
MVSSRQSEGLVRIALAPEGGNGVTERLRQLCDQINRATPATAPLLLPDVLKAINAVAV